VRRRGLALGGQQRPTTQSTNRRHLHAAKRRGRPEARA
jgi:hypothetical protein